MKKSKGFFLFRDYKCHGKYIRQICHLGSQDITEVYRRNTLSDGRQNCFVANKFNPRVDATSIICQAKRILNEENKYNS